MSQRIFLFRQVPHAGTLCDRYGRPICVGLDAEEGIPSIVVGTIPEFRGTARDQTMRSFVVKREDESRMDEVSLPSRRLTS